MSTLTVKNMSLQAGQTLTVTGVPHPDANHFEINIGNSPDEVALHVNPRFNVREDQNKVVCNSFQDGMWDTEVREGGFPFNQATPFKVRIAFTGTVFVITLPDYSVIHFPNRLGAPEYTHMHFYGDVRILSIKIE